jgi:uncharacterized membrane protein
VYIDDLGPPSRPYGRSVYAMIAPFAATCFILAFFTDLAYWATASYLWETMSVWLLTVGLIAGGFAILAGFVDLVRSRTVRGLAQPWARIGGQFVAFALSLVNVFVHSRDGYTAVVPQGLILSALVALILVVTAFADRPVTYGARTGTLTR